MNSHITAPSVTAGQYSDDDPIKYLDANFINHNLIQILFSITLALLIQPCQSTVLCNYCILILLPMKQRIK